MAWQMHDGTNDSYNLWCTSCAQGMFMFKSVLKHIGWTVPSSSDGTTYNAAGDQITQEGSGANGMDNANAWFRIQDPGALREYVFQRGANSYTWRVHYSALDKFVGGAPNATTVPTAADGKGVLAGSLNSAALFASGSNMTFNIAAQDTPVGDVYAFWLVSMPVGAGTANPSFLCCEPLNSTTIAAADTDPCVHFADPSLNQSGLQSGGTSQVFYGWQRMNQANEEWDSFMTPSSFPFVYSNYGNNPHDGIWLPQGLILARIRAASTLKGFKGVSNFIRWCSAPSSTPYGTILSNGTDFYFCAKLLALPGWPSATTKAVV
jgi:hypothetical protein